MMASSSTTGMEHLPDYDIIEICKYLTGQELGAMCATSRHWRNRLNEDIYWRWRCNAEQAQYLRETECVVEPPFVSPELKHSGLSEVCEWRLSYMRQNHLHNNWLRGKTKKHCIQLDSPSSCFVNSVFYDNDFLFLYSFGRPTGVQTPRKSVSKIEIWNVKKEPFLHSVYTTHTEHEDTYNYTHTSHYKMCVSGDLVVLIQRALVQVFTVSQSYELQLKHAFHFNKSEVLSGPMFEVPNDGFRYANAEFSTIIMGPILLGILLPYCEKKMHVWNVETGQKLKEEVYQDFAFKMICDTNSSKKNRAIVFVKEQKSIHKIVIYCTAELAFKNFCLVSKPPGFFINIIPSLGKWIVVINTSFLALRSRHNTLDVYNIDTNQLIQTYHMDGNNGICSYGNNMIFIDGVTLKSVNLISSEVQIIYDRQKHIYMSSVILEKFILFYQVENDAEQQPIICFVKDRNTTVVRSFQTNFDYTFMTNKLSTKVFSVKSGHVISVFNFW